VLLRHWVGSFLDYEGISNKRKLVTENIERIIITETLPYYLFVKGDTMLGVSFRKQ